MAHTRTCSDCPKAIGRASKTGRCRNCALRHTMTDPAVVARKRERLAAAITTPEFKRKHRASCARSAAKRMADPEQRERLVQLGRTFGIANLCLTRGGEVRARAARAIRERHLAWCPEEFWPLNRILKRNGYRLADRKVMIAGEIARHEKARVAAMSPLERQLEKLRNGAKLVEVRPIRRAGPAYTLGGVAPEAM